MNNEDDIDICNSLNYSEKLKDIVNSRAEKAPKGILDDLESLIYPVDDDLDLEISK